MTINEEINEVNKKINDGIKKYSSRIGRGVNEVVDTFCGSMFDNLCNATIRKATDKLEDFLERDAIDLNKLLRNNLTAEKTIKSWKATPEIQIPLGNPALKISSLFDEARVLWKLEDGKAFASSNPGQTIAIDACTLPSGNHTITAEMYYSPFDNGKWDKEKMVSKEVFKGKINTSSQCQ